jgi:hypothetical protein
MITGYNTDVRHDGHIYHVQTEDRGQSNPVLESLVYMGGTIIAKKATPYSTQLQQGATEEMIASLLKRQHQVIIAAIKAGRIDDLIRHTAKEREGNEPPSAAEQLAVDSTIAPVIAPKPATRNATKSPRGSGSLTGKSPRGSGSLTAQRQTITEKPAAVSRTAPLVSPKLRSNTPRSLPKPPTAKKTPSGPLTSAKGAEVDIDRVISDYKKRNEEQGKLELKVLTPSLFVAGKSIGLRVQISYDTLPEADAIVTVKVIGTAFKPQVYIGRAGRDGLASFSLALPAFTAGTAAIVIEAESSRGRGELKHLIRRA